LAHTRSTICYGDTYPAGVPAIGNRLSSDLHAPARTSLHTVQRVADEILEHTAYCEWVTHDLRQAFTQVGRQVGSVPVDVPDDLPNDDVYVAGSTLDHRGETGIVLGECLQILDARVEGPYSTFIDRPQVIRLLFSYLREVSQDISNWRQAIFYIVIDLPSKITDDSPAFRFAKT
jgi:hypothetical protein